MVIIDAQNKKLRSLSFTLIRVMLDEFPIFAVEGKVWCSVKHAYVVHVCRITKASFTSMLSSNMASNRFEWDLPVPSLENQSCSLLTPNPS